MSTHETGSEGVAGALSNSATEPPSEPCICNTGPFTDGPQEDCPQHGRPYSWWVEKVGELQQHIFEAEAALLELAPSKTCGCSHDVADPKDEQFCERCSRYTAEVATRVVMEEFMGKVAQEVAQEMRR